MPLTRKSHEINCLRFSGYYLVDRLAKIQMYGISRIHIAKIIYIQSSPNCDLVDLILFSLFKHISCLDQIKPYLLIQIFRWLMMSNSNCLNQWFLTESARIPRGVSKFPGGAKPCVLCNI